MMNRIKTYWGVRNNDNLKISRLRAINLSCLSHIGCFMVSDSGFSPLQGCYCRVQHCPAGRQSKMAVKVE